MAKKKRRGRPPGSKNKKTSVKGLTQNFAKMEVSQLRDYICKPASWPSRNSRCCWTFAARVFSSWPI